MKGTRVAIVTHFRNIRGTRNTGFGHHQSAHGEGPHTQNIGLDHPVECVFEAHPEPIAEAWGDPRSVPQLESTISRLM